MTKGPIKNVAASVRQWLRNVAHTTHRRFSDVLQHYEGVRARFQATLGNSRIAMQVDIGFSDVITPAPATIRYPSLLKLPTAELLGYNRETAIAEKFEAMVKLGELNSRMKDFFDIALLAAAFAFDGAALRMASTASCTLVRSRKRVRGPCNRIRKSPNATQARCTRRDRVSWSHSAFRVLRYRG